ncbi:hypothetical protein OB905_11705 [Halobacteria archaeon AArc-dxtr1]|nr:hypothetical protein [Halobacteria archaeon AArc-dxtr1]
MWDINVWSKRNSEPEPRIHEELTEVARKRIAHSLKFVKDNDIRSAFDSYVQYTGKEPVQFRSNLRINESQYEFLLSGDQDDVLDYLEYLLNTLWRKTQSDGFSNSWAYSTNTLVELAIKIDRSLIEEGILIQMRPSAREIVSEEWSRTEDYSQIYFQQLADETIIESDQMLRILSLGDTWKEPLEGYNEAWNLYKNETFTYVVPEKLYNSLESVCQKICVDLEGWVDDSEATVGKCLSEMRNQGLFKPNDEMVAEWQKISSGIQIGVQRTGGDRKRHERIDQDYLIMTLHQVSSFLTFVIKRYEREYSS